jgi:hypothetical protein
VESGRWKKDSTFGLPVSTHDSNTLIKKRKPSVIGLVLPKRQKTKGGSLEEYWKKRKSRV